MSTTLAMPARRPQRRRDGVLHHLTEAAVHLGHARRGMAESENLHGYDCAVLAEQATIVAHNAATVALDAAQSRPRRVTA